MDEPLPYRLITGPTDGTFCELVSKALDEGYVLHGDVAITHDGQRLVAAQAVTRATGFDGRVRPV